jgi:hypothetical protein
MTPIPPNPWMSLNEFLPHLNPAAGSAAPVETITPAPAAGAAAFQLDEAAFLAEVEPVPEFLTQPQDNRADEIEELLKIALADEWPAPPRRMVG